MSVEDTFWVEKCACLTLMVVVDIDLHVTSMQLMRPGIILRGFHFFHLHVSLCALAACSPGSCGFNHIHMYLYMSKKTLSLHRRTFCTPTPC